MSTPLLAPPPLLLPREEAMAAAAAAAAAAPPAAVKYPRWAADVALGDPDPESVSPESGDECVWLGGVLMDGLSS